MQHIRNPQTPDAIYVICLDPDGIALLSGCYVCRVIDLDYGITRFVDIGKLCRGCNFLRDENGVTVCQVIDCPIPNPQRTKDVSSACDNVQLS